MTRPNDRTKNFVKGTKRQSNRNWKAWRLYSPDGDKCRFCPHGSFDHMTSSGQPHFYRPASQSERESSTILRNHRLADGSMALVKRITVSARAELKSAFCKACAQDKDTSQVLCFERVLATGEVVGFGQEVGKETK